MIQPVCLSRRSLTRQGGGELEERLGTYVLVFAAAEERGERRQKPGGISERPILIERHGEKPLAQEYDHLGSRKHSRIRWQTELEGKLANQAIAECVERGHGGVRVAVRNELIDAGLHFLRRLVGEGEGQDFRGTSAAGGDEPGDPPRDHLGLARPRSGDDEERTFAVANCPTLLWIQSFQQGLDATRRNLGRGLRLGGAAPHGYLLQQSRLTNR